MGQSTWGSWVRLRSQLFLSSGYAPVYSSPASTSSSSNNPNFNRPLPPSQHQQQYPSYNQSYSNQSYSQQYPSSSQQQQYHHTQNYQSQQYATVRHNPRPK